MTQRRILDVAQSALLALLLCAGPHFAQFLAAAFPAITCGMKCCAKSGKCCCRGSAHTGDANSGQSRLEPFAQCSGSCARQATTAPTGSAARTVAALCHFDLPQLCAPLAIPPFHEQASLDGVVHRERPPPFSSIAS